MGKKWSILTEEDFKRIKSLTDLGLPNGTVAQALGINKSKVWRVKTCNAWEDYVALKESWKADRVAKPVKQVQTELPALSADEVTIQLITVLNNLNSTLTNLDTRISDAIERKRIWR